MEEQYQPLFDFLPCRTPQSWIEKALVNPEILLIDHANCEKKAATTALQLMHRYIEKSELLDKMSPLAREELLHFEKVVSLMKKRGVPYRYVSAARYAKELRQHVSPQEPKRLIDMLIIGAYIEARSCERFAALVPHVDDELAKFYRSLLKSEARHFEDYLQLARLYSDEDISPRVAYFADVEHQLIISADEEFRFHSGS